MLRKVSGQTHRCSVLAVSALTFRSGQVTPRISLSPRWGKGIEQSSIQGMGVLALECQ